MNLDPYMVRAMRIELEKKAEDTLKTYLPWYAAAAGGLGGSEGGAAISKRLGGKARLPLMLGGALLGTGAGVHQPSVDRREERSWSRYWDGWWLPWCEGGRGSYGQDPCLCAWGYALASDGYWGSSWCCCSYVSSAHGR